MGGSGRNIPSFEVFISPDCRYTEGYISFNQPLYRYGNLIKDIYLEFKNGKVVKATAKKGEKILKHMIANTNANMIGEFSLTDGRISKITKFMAETLFDENMGGKYGNTHIALGSAYKDSYPGDPNKVPKSQWAKMGYNESVVHTDIISTEDRTVTAWLPNGKTLVIYKDGKFTV
jgi:aminopeptidase